MVLLQPLVKSNELLVKKLHQLHNIQNCHLHLSHESPYCMQSVFYQIPTALPNNLNSAGYHRQCYQHFTSNLCHLGDNGKAKATFSQWHRSPRKSYTAGSAGPIFPPECIFCYKLEINANASDVPGWESFRSVDFQAVMLRLVNNRQCSGHGALESNLDLLQHDTPALLTMLLPCKFVVVLFKLSYSQ